MIDTTPPLPTGQSAEKPSRVDVVEGFERISTLLGDLNRLPSGTVASRKEYDADGSHENQLLAVRLGVATSLFYSLRCKHRQTAEHSLRVALGCSVWADRLQLSTEMRDRLEVAALLHDIGKIATPDRVLKKPGHLNDDERLIMEQAPDVGCEILRGCCSDESLLEILRYSRNWFHAGTDSDQLSGEDLPLGSRMLAIVESFDSMTTDQVYRRAFSQERAVAELFQYAGTQFDPDLVRDYASLLESRPELMYGAAARRWLQDLQGDYSNRFWSSSSPKPRSRNNDGALGQLLFHQHLLDTMCDGVVAIDGEGVITHWNYAFERMTNIAADAMIGQAWSDTLVRWDDSRQHPGEAASLGGCLATGAQSRRRMRLVLPDGKQTPVKVNFIPILGEESRVQGALAIVNDISQEESLEQKVQSLHVKATRDGLTGVANRAEFDRALGDVVEFAAAGKGPASLILCDIDRFKSVNDTHGHQAGDDALISFASVLERHSRDGDLVARYGGEEFALLCPGCDNATAAKRAETIRCDLERIAQPALANKCITASFGVTEYQSGDTESTIVARADRALYKAKENGRNRVVQLGSGLREPVDVLATSSKGWFHWLLTPSKSDQVKAKLATRVPVEMVIEKLRGFIADHNAEILKVQDQRLELRLDVRSSIHGRRSADGVSAFHLRINLDERDVETGYQGESNLMRETVIDANVSPWRSRDRRNREVKNACRNVIASLKSYLMADYIDRP
ncbi:putative diguanylate cyclase YdaM [Rosistilla carotiformis]|uniref:diguanylate cyclase n=1 Tax=Rosistilla carotiformis TaxID=2528017 RepID=A0A518JMP9_9BACT|nr:diguanylate cyclase [Rosistilla carotiformis]QDV66836.1 putative diguanylate cyclase YdaM [Rosistilla carotiformis]